MTTQINKEECHVLFNQKIKEGKGINQSYKEIIRDKSFEFGLNKKNRWIDLLERKIAKQDQTIENLKEKLRKMSKRIFDKKLEQLKSTNGDRLANTKDLWRVISCLESYGKTNMDKINRTCLLKSRVAANAYSFLLKTNLIKQSTVGRTIFFER